MSKPWGRYEIGYLGHSKFRALNANAICLWWEVKSYCDEHLNDGRFPQSIVRTFRFWSDKAVQLLVMSCGHTPSGAAYAPLWESQNIGGVDYFVMHDYLDHNDCREVVMARINRAEGERKLRAENQKAYRDRKKHERTVTRDDNADHNAEGHALSTLVSRDAYTPTTTQTESKETNTKTKTSPPKSSAVGPLPGFPRLRVFGWMANRFVDALGSTAFDVEGWLLSLERDSTLVVPVDDKERWTWLQQAFDFELKQRGLLKTQASDPDAELRALASTGPSVRPHQVRR